MRVLVHFPIPEIEPALSDVLEAQDVPAERAAAPRLRRLVEEAFATYAALAEPRAVYQETNAAGLAGILAPLGLPDDALVIGRLAPRAHARALYVATLGPALEERIARLFAETALAEASMLDAVASAAADRLSERLAARFADALAAGGGPARDRTLAYSPGYCGWPTSGQRALFASLAPAEIGVTLNDSCLMRPIKSVSGVLLSAPPEAHRFRPDFPFCARCVRRECGRRMASVLGATPKAEEGLTSPGTR